MFTQSGFFQDNFNFKSFVFKNINSKNNQKYKANNFQHKKQSFQINVSDISQVKEKLMRFFIRKTLISK